MDSDMEIVGLYQPSPLQCPEGRCEDLLPTFIYCVVIPAAVLVVIFIIIIAIICCSSKACKCQKYSSLVTETDDIQMESYNTIRRASMGLRQMSQNRETPMTDSRENSMTLDRSYQRTRRQRDSCHSAPGTLQRHQRNRHSGLVDQLAPPPPAYSMHSSEIFFGSEFLSDDREMHTSVQYEDSQEHNGSSAQALLYRQHLR